MKHIELGRWGEKQARDYLEGQGFVMRENNYRCKLGRD